MMRYRYDQSCKPQLLLSDLRAAIPSVNDLLTSDGFFLVEVPDDVSEGDIAAIVAAHDPTKLTASEIKERDRQAARAAFSSSAFAGQSPDEAAAASDAQTSPAGLDKTAAELASLRAQLRQHARAIAALAAWIGIED